MAHSIVRADKKGNHTDPSDIGFSPGIFCARCTLCGYIIPVLIPGRSGPAEYEVFTRAPEYRKSNRYSDLNSSVWRPLSPASPGNRAPRPLLQTISRRHLIHVAILIQLADDPVIDQIFDFNIRRLGILRRHQPADVAQAL